MQFDSNSILNWPEIYLVMQELRTKIKSLKQDKEIEKVQEIGGDLEHQISRIENRFQAIEEKIEDLSERIEILEKKNFSPNSLLEAKISAKALWKAKLKKLKYYIYDSFSLALAISAYWVTIGSL